MQCSVCEKKAVFQDPSLCADHLIAYVHDEVKKTIADFSLCSKDDKVCVAASGGKDSVALLLVLKDLGYRVEALSVDEGIANYRDHSLEDLKKVCTEFSIPLRIVSFEELTGKPLDAMVKGRYPCSVCGVFRRYLLNKYAKEYSVIATGHNLDDEAQAVLMNLIKGHKDLLHRSHIRTLDAPGFVPRIKPFMFLPEKIILAYTLVRGLSLGYVECPYAYTSLRSQVRDVLNKYEQGARGMKRSLVDAALHVAVTKQPVGVFHPCVRCGEPSVTEVCRACVLREELA